MNDFAKNFLSSIQVPESIKSSESSNTYSIIAKKEESALALSVVMNILQTAKFSRPVFCLLVRLIEKRPDDTTDHAFTAFTLRKKSVYVSNVDGKVPVFLLDKLTLPLTEFPASGAEISKMLNDNKIFESLRIWLTERIVKSGGAVTVSEDTFNAILASKLETLNSVQQYLFKLPELSATGTIVEPVVAPPVEEVKEAGEVVFPTKTGIAKDILDTLSDNGYKVFDLAGTEFAFTLGDFTSESFETESLAWAAAFKHWAQKS